MGPVWRWLGWAEGCLTDGLRRADRALERNESGVLFGFSSNNRSGGWLRGSSGGQQIDDPLKGLVGPAVGRLQLGGRLQRGVGGAMEETISQGPTNALVEEDKEQADAVSLGGEAVTVASPDPVQEAVALHLRRS